MARALISEQKLKVLEFINSYGKAHGVPPTLREMSAAFGWKAVGSAQDVVNSLRKKGLLAEPVAGKSRQIFLSVAGFEAIGITSAELATGQSKLGQESTVTISSANLMHVPLLGQIQAGTPRESMDTTENTVPFMTPKMHSKISSYFALTVDGYSMVQAGFLPGDVLLVEKTTNARNGDIVVASVEFHQTTVKRFAMRGSHLYRSASEQWQNKRDMPTERHPPPVLLLPENPDFEAIPFGLKETDTIVGLVRSLYRKEI